MPASPCCGRLCAAVLLPLLLLPSIQALATFPNPFSVECDTDNLVLLQQCFNAARAMLSERAGSCASTPNASQPHSPLDLENAGCGVQHPVSFEQQTQMMFHRVTGM
jgi:hypothetical protein